MDCDSLATSGTGLKSSEFPKKHPDIGHLTTSFFSSNIMLLHHNVIKSMAVSFHGSPVPPYKKDSGCNAVKLFCL